MAGNNPAQLELSSAEKRPMLPAPPYLKVICSVGCGLPARDFIRLLQTSKVTVLLDTRRTRDYRGVGFSTREADFSFLCELAGIRYVVAEQLMPTEELRGEFTRTFKEIQLSADRDPHAWSKFLTGYQTMLTATKPLTTGLVHDVLYGSDTAVAITCACSRHEDCHRLLATTMIARYLPGVELRVLYPDKKPNRATPRRYRTQPFPYFGLEADAPKAKR